MGAESQRRKTRQLAFVLDAVRASGTEHPSADRIFARVRGVLPTISLGTVYRNLHRLAADPSLIPAAVEEMLRWGSVTMQFRRTATRDTELGDVPVREGDKVVVYFISANYDEEVFADPFRFDIARDPNPHVAFGSGGPHFCLGAPLARMEMRVMFEELLPRLARVDLVGLISRLRSNFINGIKHMPVRVELA